LRRGVTFRGRLVGPKGEPVSSALVFTGLRVDPLTQMWRSAAEVRDGRFELPGCDPDKTYLVSFLDPKNQWGASVTLSGKQAGTAAEVRLAPCGKATARFVDSDGKPLAKFRPMPELVVTPGPHRYDLGAYEKGLFVADGDFLANLDPHNY